MPSPTDRRASTGRCLVVFSSKGGVGKTLVATNLAVALANEYRESVCLVDLDLMAVGDAAKLLGFSTKSSLVDVLPHVKDPTALSWMPVSDLVQVHASGVHFLQGVSSPRQMATLDPGTIQPLFQLLRTRYHYVIVDGGKAFTDQLIAACDEASLILLVVTPDIVTLYQTKWALGMLESLLFPASMVRAILNRAESRGGVESKDVRLAMPCQVIGEIPSDGKVVGDSVNAGSPVVLMAEHSKVAEAFRQVTQQLVTSPMLYTSRRQIPRHQRPGAPPEAASLRTAASFKLFAAEPSVEEAQSEDEVVRLKRRIHQQLVSELNLKTLDLAILSRPSQVQELRQQCERVVGNLLSREVGGILASREVRAQLVKEIVDEALGLGPLEELLADPEVSDILVNSKDQIYVERHGKLELTAKKFVSNDQVLMIIDRIVAPLGRRIDEASPMVDARLPDGSRVNAIIPPLAVRGPVLSIRKFVGIRYTKEDLLRFGSLTEPMAQFIQACVMGRKNLVISGGTGSGKTTMLNVLSSFIPSHERIVTIEDAAELKLAQTHWVSLEARPPNVEGKGQVMIRDLFRNALRMRPDRIIIGECRGGETLDMLQAMNTGHDGSLTTVHANSPKDVVARLDSMVLMSNVDLPVRAIREMVASAIHVIVHTARLSDGSRKVVSIVELTGLEQETEIRMQELFVFRQTGIAPDGTVLGEFVSTGHPPTFLHELAVKGIPIDEAIFRPSPEPTTPVGG